MNPPLGPQSFSLQKIKEWNKKKRMGYTFAYPTDLTYFGGGGDDIRRRPSGSRRLGLPVGSPESDVQV
jgi:hypothetical protein